MLVPCNNPQGYKEHAILFIVFAFGEGGTIIYWLSNMKIYVSNIEESYKYTIIGKMGNSGTAYLLLHIVRFWCVYEVNKEYQALPLVL